MDRAEPLRLSDRLNSQWRRVHGDRQVDCCWTTLGHHGAAMHPRSCLSRRCGGTSRKICEGTRRMGSLVDSLAWTMGMCCAHSRSSFPDLPDVGCTPHS
jgi:hypothetical protein